MPLAADGLQLQDSSVLGMEEVVTIREYASMIRANSAFRPSRRLGATAILRCLGRLFNSKLHRIFDAGRKRRNQLSPTFDLCAHTPSDAREGFWLARFFQDCDNSLNPFSLSLRRPSGSPLSQRPAVDPSNRQCLERGPQNRAERSIPVHATLRNLHLPYPKCYYNNNCIINKL